MKQLNEQGERHPTRQIDKKHRVSYIETGRCLQFTGLFLLQSVSHEEGGESM